MKDAQICSNGQKPKDGKCETGRVAVIYRSGFEFDTGGKKISIGKIARGLAKQMDRKYVGHSARKEGTIVRGELISTKKGARLNDAQIRAAKEWMN